MKTNKTIYPLLIGLGALGLSSCNDFLDKNPDNRTALDSEEKIVNMNVSAYPEHNPFYFTELASDNCDSHGSIYTIERFDEQSFKWEVITEGKNHDPSSCWEDYYKRIATANMVLDACAEIPQTAKIKAAKGEALICRAFAHFWQVNTFCQNYDTHYPDDMGIPYMETSEKELAPKYQRGTVAEVYAKIEKDIEEGLPLISDAIYKVPKYHFNQRAAYAFAAQFYLFYEKWDKAIEYATKALGTQPANQLRNYPELLAYPFNNHATLTVLNTFMASPQHNCNYLIGTAYSQIGALFSGTGGTNAAFSHGQMVAHYETTGTFEKFPSTPLGNKPTYIIEPGWWANGLDKVIIPSAMPYIFEMTDPVAEIGYPHSLHTLLTADLTLLVRAEAYIMQKNYTAALADMNLWAKNRYSSYSTLTEASIQAWADKTAYYTPEAPTAKKKINPGFVVENGLQEAMIQTLLYTRRIETMHHGLRWFDVKRYGIEIYRRTLTNDAAGIKSVDDQLVVRDDRRAIQIPIEVIAAGLTPNPRSK